MTVYRAAATIIEVGGTATIAMYAPLIGGFITNPSAAADQDLPQTEPLFVDFTGPAALTQTSTTFELLPGASVVVPANDLLNVWVNAASSGHKFSAVVIQNPVHPYPPEPLPGTFPPTSPTTVTKTIPSYLYQQYADDDDLQAFVAAYNTLAQEYVDWFVDVGLPIYTGLSGGLLDWVGTNLYGMPRPSLPTSTGRPVGPFNTFGMNQGAIPFNYYDVVGATPFFATDDDTYKRILTWLFFKGDGKVFTIPWLKRRVMRYLNGINGVNYNVDQTYPVSVSFGSGNTVNIDVGIYNPTLQEAIESGILELPFQYDFVVTNV